jgi:hypothetical protein
VGWPQGTHSEWGAWIVKLWPTLRQERYLDKEFTYRSHASPDAVNAWIRLRPAAVNPRFRPCFRPRSAQCTQNSFPSGSPNTPF